MPVKTRGEAIYSRAETKRCHAKILQLYGQFATCMGVGTQDIFGSYKHSPQSQLSETFNAKLRTGWRNACETA
jgi:hypothetical protein